MPTLWHAMWQSSVASLSLTPRLWARIRWILSQFLTTHCKKILMKTPIPGGVCASRPWSFSSAYKNFNAQHPLKPKYGLPKKSIWWVNISHMNASGPKFTKFLSSNAKQIAIDNLVFCPILDSSTSSKYNCGQSLKTSKIAPNWTCFWPANFVGGRLPNC